MEEQQTEPAFQPMHFQYLALLLDAYGKECPKIAVTGFGRWHF